MSQARCLAREALEDFTDVMKSMALDEMPVSGCTTFSTLYTYTE